jgi:hypothetical protein
MRIALLHPLLAAPVIAAVVLVSPSSPTDVESTARAAGVPVATRSADAGRRIPRDFVGLSIEWSLVERYMGAPARPAFANLLRNLGSGVLRIGGDSQDLLPFTARGRNSERVVTPADLRAIRATLDAVRAGEDARWTTTLGAAMAPGDDAGRARRFARAGVGPAFAGAEQLVAGVELGNEPDLTYRADRGRYLRDVARHAPALGRFPLVGPGSSEPIAPWARIADGSEPQRFYRDWPAILAQARPRIATDHFYPLARDCASAPYRCATIARLLSDERAANLAHQVADHAAPAARLGIPYRIEETNSVANRGLAGVSDVAASAVWALDAMFTAACPRPAGRAGCAPGASGVGFHNAGADADLPPSAGNARYNPVAYDPAGPAAPRAMPEYYALLLFARFAAGTRDPRPVTLGRARAVKAWLVDAGAAGERLFVINRGARAARVPLGRRALTIDRMTPFDPRGAGRTLDAPAVRIDGRAVAADGSWPGFAPARFAPDSGPNGLRVGGGEVAVIALAP